MMRREGGKDGGGMHFAHLAGSLAHRVYSGTWYVLWDGDKSCASICETGGHCMFLTIDRFPCLKRERWDFMEFDKRFRFRVKVFKVSE